MHLGRRQQQDVDQQWKDDSWQQRAEVKGWGKLVNILAAGSRVNCSRERGND